LYLRLEQNNKNSDELNNFDRIKTLSHFFVTLIFKAKLSIHWHLSFVLIPVTYAQSAGIRIISISAGAGL
jgi:hypothetical protein